MENLVNLYFTSVGRNGKLLLNVPPTRDGVLHPTDVARLTALGAIWGASFLFMRIASPEFGAVALTGARVAKEKGWAIKHDGDKFLR